MEDRPEGTLVLGEGLRHQGEGTLVLGEGLRHQGEGTLVLGEGLRHQGEGTLVLGEGLRQQEEGRQLRHLVLVLSFLVEMVESLLLGSSQQPEMVGASPEQ